MLLDCSVTAQRYVEDCEVCCRPIEVWYRAEQGEIAGFQARQLE